MLGVAIDALLPRELGVDVTEDDDDRELSVLLSDVLLISEYRYKFI